MNEKYINLENKIRESFNNDEFENIDNILRIIIEEFNNNELINFIRYYKNNIYAEYTNKELYKKKNN
jgi:hypothetical protein